MSITVLNVEVHKRRQSYDNRGRPNMTWRELYAKPRLYLSLDSGDDGKVSPMQHILFDRYDAQALHRFARENGLLTEILTQAGVNPTTKLVFSRKAGCSCGCSPASILQLSNESFNIYATIGDAEAVKAAASYREGTKFIRAIKGGRGIIKNAWATGLKQVELKKLKTYWSDADYHSPFAAR